MLRGRRELRMQRTDTAAGIAFEQIGEGLAQLHQSEHCVEGLLARVSAPANG